MVMEGDLIIYKIGFSWLADMVVREGVCVWANEKRKIPIDLLDKAYSEQDDTIKQFIKTRANNKKL